jgi:hypothetical protein
MGTVGRGRMFSSTFEDEYAAAHYSVPVHLRNTRLSRAEGLVCVTIGRDMFDEWAFQVWRAYVIFDILEAPLL